jgi:hypothetical protein
MLEILLAIVAVIGIAVILHKTMNRESVNSFGNSSKPNHQRVIKKTN